VDHETVTLPEGATHLGTLSDQGASVSLCDIGGVCWMYGLESTAKDPDLVLGLVRQVEDMARRAGYPSVMAESANQQLLGVVRRWGYSPVSVVLEKTL